MTVLAGQIILADHMNRARADIQNAVASSDLTLTTSYQDVAGTEISFTTTAANAEVAAICDLDAFAQDQVNGVTVVGALLLDGSVIMSGPVFNPVDGGADGGRASVSLTDTITVAAAGAHTLKLQARKDTNSGTYRVIAGSTRVTAIISEVI